uniref:Uncharacterized protein n=1 Tax=Aegilops tauschii subsp. strangulata TaxID=200361 RepID=A0A453LB69_AEGTS
PFSALATHHRTTLLLALSIYKNPRSTHGRPASQPPPQSRTESRARNPRDPSGRRRQSVGSGRYVERQKGGRGGAGGGGGGAHGGRREDARGAPRQASSAARGGLWRRPGRALRDAGQATRRR